MKIKRWYELSHFVFESLWNFSLVVDPTGIKVPSINISATIDWPQVRLDCLTSEVHWLSGILTTLLCSGLPWGQKLTDLCRGLSWDKPKYIHVIWSYAVAKCKQCLLLQPRAGNWVKLCKNPCVDTSHHLFLLACSSKLIKKVTCDMIFPSRKDSTQEK